MIATAILIPTFYPRCHAVITVGETHQVRYILHYNGFGIQTQEYAQFGSREKINTGSLWDEWSIDDYNNLVGEMTDPDNRNEYLGDTELHNFKAFTLPRGGYILPHFIDQMGPYLKEIFGIKNLRINEVLPYTLIGPENNILEFLNGIMMNLDKF